jgi:hypothetical protein
LHLEQTTVLKVDGKEVASKTMKRKLSHWHPISTAPCNQDAELRVVDEGKVVTLQFPCLQLNVNGWMDVDLGTRIDIEPVEWRIWQHSKSPQPHRSPVHGNDKSALLHTDHPKIERVSY